jgi:hypothetical protein
MLFNISTKANNPPPIPYIDIYHLNKLLMSIQGGKQFLGKEFKEILSEFIHRVEDTFENKTKLITNTTEFTRIKEIYKSQKSSNSTFDFTNYKNDLIGIINEVNKFNAASAIGTLEFLPSDILKALDPIAYNEGLLDFEDMMLENVEIESA